jgi:hypothetical protein
VIFVRRFLHLRAAQNNFWKASAILFYAARGDFPFATTKAFLAFAKSRSICLKICSTHPEWIARQYRETHHVIIGNKHRKTVHARPVRRVASPVLEFREKFSLLGVQALAGGKISKKRANLPAGRMCTRKGDQTLEVLRISGLPRTDQPTCFQ